jgi:hypothetical protein
MQDFYIGQVSSPELNAITVWFSGSGGSGKTSLNSCAIADKPTLIRAAEPLLGSVTIFLYSLRKSSSGVGFWKNSIHGFIISTDM